MRYYQGKIQDGAISVRVDETILAFIRSSVPEIDEVEFLDLNTGEAISNKISANQRVAIGPVNVGTIAADLKALSAYQTAYQEVTSELKATGRQLIEAADILSNDPNYPASLTSDLLTFIDQDIRLRLSWSADTPMRRGAPEFQAAEASIAIALNLPPTLGAQIIDQLFLSAQTVEP